MDNELVKKASSIIDEIRSHQKTTDDKLQNLDRQIDDLNRATKMFAEARAKPVTTVTGPEDALSLYVQKDGVQLVEERRMVQTPNGTTPVTVKGLLDDDPVCEWQQGLQKIANDRALLRMMQRNPHTPQTDLKLYKHLLKAPRSIRPALEKAYSDVAGSGLEWIPDSFAPSLFESFKVRSSLADAFETVKNGISSNTLLIPRIDKKGTPYVRGAVTDSSSLEKTTVTTAQASISIPSFAVSMVIDSNAAEDSFINIMSALRSAAVDDIRDGFEDCCINGATNPIQDNLPNWNIRSRWSGTLGSSTDHRTGFNGLRYHAFDKGSTDDLSDSLDYDELMALRYQIGEQGYNDCMIIVSPEIYIKYLLAMTQLVTRDVYGEKAVVLSGEVSQIAGMPVICSRYLGADMNLVGKYDNSTKTKSGILIVNRSSYKIFERSGLQVEQNKDIQTGGINLVCNYRAILASADASATKNVSYGFNL